MNAYTSFKAKFVREDGQGASLLGNIELNHLPRKGDIVELVWRFSGNEDSFRIEVVEVRHVVLAGNVKSHKITIVYKDA